ncbi:hypothetical protein [Nostoc sp. 'Peltigera malacea cyanobiont' DB3992]|uniref:hypothetical protein n=1 Tax=Nostoc sp. 'Peltigera malacea cyanobiont' DB3992 TaxID=1206980 RepID=UPI000C041C28|nr:hypothetical protein [Nostoc sp. 'Peltigera malacea cyanobiont' DB3992]PHM06718.1 hypothetical protein CK516_31705 [Nostoc sp. 'Peltigera malacea cyanobiont' DB3992]
MKRKWIISLLILPIPILALIYTYNSRAQTIIKIAQNKATIDEIKPVLTVGLDQPVDISPNAQKILQGYEGEFKSAVPLPDITVSAQKALELANKITLSSLTQPPIQTTVEYLSYTDKGRGLVNKNVWRVVYWGSPIMMTAPRSPANADASISKVEQPSSKKAITYVLIDPNDPDGKNGFITRVSAGPVHD